MELPDSNVPESQKNEKWHLEMADSFIRLAYNNPVMQKERWKDGNNYAIVNGEFNPKQYRYITDIGTKTSPARFVNHPIIMNKLNLLAGELAAQELQFDVETVNQNARVRKLDKRMAVAAETVMRPIRREIEKDLGIQLEDEEVDEIIPEDVEQFSNMKFRDATEEMVRVGLDHIILKQELKQVFNRGIYDATITNKEFYKVSVRNGDPYIKRLDSRSMIYDPDTDREDICDSKFAGDENFLTVPEIVEEYNPDDKFLNWLLELESKGDEYYASYNREVGYNCYQYEPNKRLKILVTNLEWKDIKKLRYKESKNSYDPNTPYIKKLGEKDKVSEKDKVINKRVVQIRYVVKIGEKLMDWGVCGDRYETEDNYANSKLSYHGMIKNNFNGSTLSVVDVLANIQEEYNITKFNIRLTQQRAGGKAIVYDTSQMPKGYTFDDVQYHLKNSGLVPVNLKQEGAQYGNAFNQWKEVDLTLSNSLTQLMNYLMILEDSASKLTGLTDARAGITKPGDLVGVNNANIMQSSLVTAPLFDSHFKLVGNVLNHAANLFRYCWGDDERMLPVFGDTLFQMLKIDKRIKLDEYGIYVLNNSKANQDKAELKGLINAYAANGGIDALTAIKIINAGSATEMEAIANSALKVIAENEKSLEERKVAAQEEANKIAMQKITMPLEVAKVNAASAEKVAEINGQYKLQANGETLRHNEDMQEVENNNELDKMMLETANEEQQVKVKAENPEKKKPAAKPAAKK